MTQERKPIEEHAHDLLADQKYQEAADLYLQAAKGFQRQAKHDRAAVCLAAAAGSMGLLLGEKTYNRVATLYEEAAQEAEITQDLEYASMLYKYAAVCYERDHDSNGYSDCFFKSKEMHRKFLWLDLFQTKKTKDNVGIKFSFQLITKRFIPLFTSTFSSVLWGHGERPHRTVGFGLILILVFAAFYLNGQLNREGTIISPNIIQSIYFSFTTYTKVGPENMTPVGFNKVYAVIEAFIGIFTIPIYLTGLCRKYLR